MLPLKSTLSRRALLSGSAAMGAAALAAPAVRAQGTPADSAETEFAYEITRTEAEWRAQLSELEYAILREGNTERTFISSYASEDNPGLYHCKGCDLPLYSSEWYSPQEIGFVFFEHSIPNAVLTGIDITDYNGALPEPTEFFQVHCRRCGSHLGHIVAIRGQVLHCINGTSLRLEPAEA